ncbi:MAG: hypothetical protein ABI672_07385 [Vicinamibacteria bacterium]
MKTVRILALGAVVLPVLGVSFSCSRPPEPAKSKAVIIEESASLRRIRQVFARVPETLAKNFKEFDGPSGRVSGFGAGDAYPQIWLRDSAWIVDAAGAWYPKETLTSWLDLHLAHANKDGRLRDWVAKGSADAFREWAPHVESKNGFAFDTNSNESDQEPSAALAYCRAEALLGAAAPANTAARNVRVSKLIAALNALIRDRMDAKSGLIWSGLTADWGDVSPMYPDQRAIYFDTKTPRTLSLYSNVMAYGALKCLSTLDGPTAQQEALAERATRLRNLIRSAFWMKDAGFFRVRLPFDELPAGFADDDARFALGGNALAALFGVADQEQATAIFETAERLRVAQSVSTISTVLMPPYAEGVFTHPAMREPFRYQNGGQWDWFGAALVEAEFERGSATFALTHLNQIVSRILHAGPGIHEWYGRDGTPEGSAAYAAAAASLHNAIVKGLLGVTRSPNGYRVAIRTGESLLPFEIPLKAAGDRLVVKQTVTERAIEVEIESSARLAEVCTLPPLGRTADDMSAADMAVPRSLQTIGKDTLTCADVSSSARPIRVRFGISASR